MGFFKQFKDDMAEHRALNTQKWREFKLCVWVLSALSLVMIGLYRTREVGPWYLGCADRHGKELLLRTDKKPLLDNGVIMLGKDMFVTPEAGMTCRIVTIKQAEEEKQAIDNPI